MRFVLGEDFFFLEAPVGPLESFFDCLIWFRTSVLMSSLAMISACFLMSSWSCSRSAGSSVLMALSVASVAAVVSVVLASLFRVSASSLVLVLSL